MVMADHLKFLRGGVISGEAGAVCELRRLISHP